MPKSPSAAEPLIRKAVEQLDADGGWVSLGSVGQRLLALAPDFDHRNFGCKKNLTELVKKTGGFDVEQREGGAVQIRVKPAAQKKVRGETKAAG